VGPDNLLIDAATLTARFDLLGKGSRVVVVYRGLLPEMFRNGATVVVEGTADDQGVFHSDLILTKCASKYEARLNHAEPRS
jgi:cytochrome c-type biogenesis protein CcmE